MRNGCIEPSLCDVQATVGAGLPVIATLQHLVHTGDRILKVPTLFFFPPPLKSSLLELIAFP